MFHVYFMLFQHLKKIGVQKIEKKSGGLNNFFLENQFFSFHFSFYAI